MKGDAFEMKLDRNKKDKTPLEMVTQYRRRWFKGQATKSIQNCNKTLRASMKGTIYTLWKRIRDHSELKKRGAYGIWSSFCLIRGKNGAKRKTQIQKTGCFQLV